MKILISTPGLYPYGEDEGDVDVTSKKQFRVFNETTFPFNARYSTDFLVRYIHEEMFYTSKKFYVSYLFIQYF